MQYTKIEKEKCKEKKSSSHSRILYMHGCTQFNLYLEKWLSCPLRLISHSSYWQYTELVKKKKKKPSDM